MVNDRKELINSFKRWITQTAREQRCTDDEIVNIVHEFIVDSITKDYLC